VAASASPTASGAPPPCEPNGTTLQITAPAGASSTGFDTTCLAAPAGEGFTVQFTNDDASVPHNFEIYADSSASKRLGGATGPGDFITGPATATYNVDSLDPGIYYFQCDIHPQAMNGTFAVVK